MVIYSLALGFSIVEDVVYDQPKETSVHDTCATIQEMLKEVFATGPQKIAWIVVVVILLILPGKDLSILAMMQRVNGNLGFDIIIVVARSIWRFLLDAINCICTVATSILIATQ